MAFVSECGRCQESQDLLKCTSLFLFTKFLLQHLTLEAVSILTSKKEFLYLYCVATLAA